MWVAVSMVVCVRDCITHEVLDPCSRRVKGAHLLMHSSNELVDAFAHHEKVQRPALALCFVVPSRSPEGRQTDHDGFPGSSVVLQVLPV